MKQNRNIYLFFITLIILLVFWPMQDVFYQQDEWKALGSYFALTDFWGIFKNTNLLKIILADGRIFSSIVGFLLLGKFPFNTTPLFFYSLVFHLVNSFLVYLLSLRFLKNKILSTVAAVFFGVCSVSAGAVSWYSTSIGTLPAATFIFLSLYFFLKNLEKNKENDLTVSFVLLYVSLFFKETGFFFLLVFPLLSLIYKRIPVKEFVFKYWYFFVSFVVIALFRYFEVNSYKAESVVFTTTTTNHYFITIFLRGIFYPLTSFFLIFVPSEFFIQIAKYFTNAYYPFFPTQHYSLIVQSVVGDLLAIIGSLGVLITLYLLTSNGKDRKNLTFLIIFSLTTYLPYIILSKDYTYLDSRYYYLGAAPAGMLLGFLLLKIKERLGKKIYVGGFLIVLVYLLILGYITRGGILKLAEISRERLGILKQLSVVQPKLEDKNIFLVSGNKNFYLTENNHIPMQQGVGYTILTWYSKDDPRFKEFLADEDLWDLGSQGYFEKDREGFGYFWDKNLLEKTVKEKGLEDVKITSVYYDGETHQLRKIN